MKTCAERGKVPRKGYEIAPCAQCGELVVHSIRQGYPLQAHRYSKKCARLAKERERQG